ncbi:MAG: RNA-binding S4 domain-containing protein [Clostridia bacterium]|nr:RNA-binding S4 domain-containing protein [Clostridia bacterium]MBQ5771402.1 RNA-binding S4 domain-containing protein [Clostridia bacterium]MCR5073001.1 RNA-binding S4 domain-containing protein [Clostridiales bacterium]
MRLDKYLKISRIIKRRTVANEAAGAGRISINGKTAKPSSDVNVGDLIEIRFGSRSMTVRVDSISEYATKAGAAEMYTVISESGATQDAE